MTYLGLLLTWFAVLALLQPFVLTTQGCPWEFVRYEPSALEVRWTTNIKDLQANTVGGISKICPQTVAERDLMDRWIAAIGHFARGERPRPEIFKQVHEVMSRFVFRRSCDKEERIVWIEPLAGPLRHPYYCIHGSAYLVDKGYMLVGDLAASQLRDSGQPHYARYFDAGASLYTAGAGGASQKWLVDTFRTAHNISFADIVAWEATAHPAPQVFAQIPGAIKPHYHWFNVPASPVPGDSDNPLTHVKELCKRRDYVVFKLDIDTPSVETPLANQLLTDPVMHGLVDEFFFEYHVDMPEMYAHWGSNLPERPDAVLAYFSALRNLGVRAHIWV